MRDFKDLDEASNFSIKAEAFLMGMCWIGVLVIQLIASWIK